MEIIKVLHLSTGRSWRGGENQLRFLLKGLQGRGIESHVLVQPGTPLSRKFSDYATVHETRMRNDMDLFAVFRIAVLCEKNAFEVIHAHTARGHLLALLAKKIIRSRGNPAPRLVVHRRSEHRGAFSFIDRWKYLNEDVDLFICISKAIAEGLRACGIMAERLQVVHSAVDPRPHSNYAAQRTAVREEFNVAADQPVVCCVAAMEKLKGVDVLLQAWKVLAEKGFSGKLVMIGEGALLEKLREYVRKSGLAGSVLFTGFREDVQRLMAGSDILALPTLSEGLGTVLLDGLLAGCALVASDVGGVPEVVIDQTTGILVPPGDPAALVKAIERLAGDPGLRGELVNAGRRLIESQFSIEDMVEKTCQIYKDLGSIHSR